ncbi:MAG: sigma-54 dependent transcriptional regulator [Bacteroidota bacterium]
MNLQSIKLRFGIIGRSQALDLALETAVRVAATDLTVLITGESGVGKEAFSKIIHQLSPRKHSKFIPVNTGAIPDGTINSELFGHEKGAFTGATSERKGYFETADEGTIFLDEIGEMPLDTQAYLLRILENGEFIRVGSSQVHRTDVRVIAATNVDLEKRVKAGKFREDLYYRLKTIPIQVPSLKERPDDIPMLFRKFALDFAEKYRADPIRLDEKASLLLQRYSWPGNIRELKNVVEQISVLSESRHLTAEDLIQFIPNILKRNLPALANQLEEGQDSLREREILYKLLFEMKSDLNDLKSLVLGLISNNDLEVPNVNTLRQLQAPDTRNYPSYSSSTSYEAMERPIRQEEGLSPIVDNEHLPIIINKGDESENGYGESEILDENLKLEDMEKKMIVRALKKYKGRRKDAAMELGISERTLYRKIKQYNL